MPDREDMQERLKSGPSDEFQPPQVNREVLPGVMEAGQGGGGGGSVNWRAAFEAAMNTPPGGARDALLRTAKKRAETALDGLEDVDEMNRVAAKIAEIEGLMEGSVPVGTMSNPVAQRPEAGSGNREVIRLEGELAMKLRGHIIKLLDEGNVDAGMLSSGMEKFVADLIRKNKEFIVLDEATKKEFEEEIKVRTELQRASKYWIDLKSEPIPLKKMRETIVQAVVLSPESERWLERPNHDCSYIDEVTGDRVEIRDLAKEINLTAKKLLENMGKPKADPESIDLQKLFIPRDYIGVAEKLTPKTNVGVITLQMAEAGIWAAEIEIPDEGFRHPAADVVRCARTRFLAASKGKPALNGHRLIQEYQEKNHGRMPDDERVFFPEGESLGRTELDMFEGARAAIESGTYLTKRKEKRRGPGLSFSEEVKDDLVAACQFLTSLSELTGAESALDPNSLVGKFFVIKINLGKVATRFMPTKYAGGVDVNEASRKAWIGKVMTETVKTGVWANSLLNKWNSKSVLNMPDLYQTARLAISSLTDAGEPLYIGTALSKEEAKRVAIQFVDWFERLWKRYEPIIEFRKRNPFYKNLPAYWQRDSIPDGITVANRGMFRAEDWRGLLKKGLVEFKRLARSYSKAE